MTDSNVPSAIQGVAAALSAEDLALLHEAGTTSDFKKEDLLIPFLLIVQATSGYVQRNDPDFVDSARPGDIIDSLTRWPRPRVAFVPCKFETTYTEWKPNRGGLVKAWGTDASGYDQAEGDFGKRTTAAGNDIVPAATYYGLVIHEDDGSTMPVVCNMSGTQFRKSRRFNTLINMYEEALPDGSKFNPPMYSRVYSMETVPESNDQGAWHGWKIEPGPKLLAVTGGRAVFEKAKALRAQIEAGTARAAPVPTKAPDDDVPF